MRLKEVVVARTDKRLAGLLATAVSLLAWLAYLAMACMWPRLLRYSSRSEIKTLLSHLANDALSCARVSSAPHMHRDEEAIRHVGGGLEIF
jgi:hypothetical protein